MTAVLADVVADAQARAVAMPVATAWQLRYVRLLKTIDLLGISLGLTTGLFARFGVRPVALHGAPYPLVLAAAGVLWLVALSAGGCYDRRILGNGAAEFKRVATSCFRLVGAVAVVSFVLKLDLARGLVAVAFPCGAAFLLSFRYGARKWLHRQRRLGGWCQRVLVVGDRKNVAYLARTLNREQYAGYRVIGACVPHAEAGTQLPGGIAVLGTVTSAVAAARAEMVDAIAVTASTGVTAEAVRRLGWELEGSGIGLMLAPALTDVAGPRIHITPAAGLPLLHVDEPEFTGARRVYKEVADRVIAAAVLVLLAPLGTVLALAVKLGSDGPVLFRQQRVGLDGRTFSLLKFRSMYVDAEARLAELAAANEHDGLLFKMREDPRVTRVGRWLRKYSLDELPQLWNVVRGDMALVGPRPPLPSEVARYESDVRRRLLVKPGITGLWQVSGRADLSWEDSVRLDLYYVENWSPALDAMILWKTFFAVVKGTGAY